MLIDSIKRARLDACRARALARSQENRILTPILFSLLLIIVFFIWVNVMVAIISEVYQKESSGNGELARDDLFDSMTAAIRQPNNDVAALVPHQPVRPAAGGPLPPVVALCPSQYAPAARQSRRHCFLRKSASYCMRRLCLGELAASQRLAVRFQCPSRAAS